LSETLSTAFDIHAVDARLEVVAGPDLPESAERALARARANELDAIVVGGGDGSIRAVASVLAGSGVPLGILPLGTRIHFARDLGIPVDLDGAVAVIAIAQARFADLVDVNGRTFINSSSIGIYPYLVIERERRRRRYRLSKWAAMMLAGLRVLRHLPAPKLSVGVDGAAEPCRSPCLFVGNNVYTMGLPALGRRERLDGGELCLYVARTQDRLALVWLAFKAVVGRLDHARDLRVLVAPAAEIHSRQRRLLVALDGEVEILRPPLRYRICPGALRVIG